MSLIYHSLFCPSSHALDLIIINLMNCDMYYSACGHKKRNPAFEPEVQWKGRDKSTAKDSLKK